MRTRTPLTSLLVASLLVAASACQDPAVGDDEHASFTGPGGAADGFGIEEGSCDARAALEVANEASEEDLIGVVGLRSHAARNVVEARPLDTLAELDAVRYIGPVSFELLLAHADAQGLVAACAAPAATGGYRVTLHAIAGGEGFDESYGEWTYDDYEGHYVHEATFDVDALPLSHRNGDLSVRVSEDGEIDVSYIYGDYDGSAITNITVPLSVPAGTTYEVQLRGGEHASGSWSVSATVTLEVL